MNCNEFLEALTSSDEGRQTAARWHTKTCPACAALADVDALLKKELAAPEPLPQRLRAAWAGAADSLETRSVSEGISVRTQSESQFSPRHLPMQLASLAAALLLLVTVTLVLWKATEIGKPVGFGPIDSPKPTIVIKTLDASADLTALLAQVDALDAELSKISQKAELVDARREADALLATFNNW
jgi:hypothetical protein